MCRPRAPLLDEPQLQTRHPSRFYCFGRSINRNVAWTWAAVLAQGLADSIWAGTVLVKFLNELLGNNAYVGYIEAASGAANLIVALPVGACADRLGKGRVARWGGALIPFGVALTAYAASYGTSHPPTDSGGRLSLLLLFVAVQCLWGVVSAVGNGPAQALYADSVATGERSHAYTALFVIYLLASVVGPALTIVLFESHGEATSYFPLLGTSSEPSKNLPRTCSAGGPHLVPHAAAQRHLRRPRLRARRDGRCQMLIRTLPPPDPHPNPNPNLPPPGYLMLRDKHAVGDEEPPTDGTRPASDAEAGGGGGSGGGSGEGGSGGGGEGEGGGEGGGECEGGDKPAAEGELSPHVWAVPYVLFASSVCFALGSGMTARSHLAPLPGPSRARRLLHVGWAREQVKFFPLFFVNDCGLAPAQVWSSCPPPA